MEPLLGGAPGSREQDPGGCCQLPSRLSRQMWDWDPPRGQTPVRHITPSPYSRACEAQRGRGALATQQGQGWAGL